MYGKSYGKEKKTSKKKITGKDLLKVQKRKKNKK